MKLPPLALTAPSLCPRCDAPAMFVDECAQCALPLRQCPSCLGVAGPFDRYCGFCGNELVLGRRPAVATRLWLLAGLLPILVALGIGLSPLGQAAVRGVTGRGAPPISAAVHPNLTDRALGFSAVAPAGWSYTPGVSASLGALTSTSADSGIPAAGPGGLLTASPKGAVLLLGRPAVVVPGVDPSDPVAVLAAQTSQLGAAPPAGFTLTTVTPVEQRTIGGRRAAYSLLSVAGPDGSPRLFERVYIATGRGLFLVEGLFPADAASASRSFLDSLRLTG
jgi:hypothetical protein